MAGLALADQDQFIPDVDEEKIDATGLVWAAKHYGNDLYTYDGHNWQQADRGLNADAVAEFRGMTTTADGAVVVIWVVKGDGLAVTRHRGNSSTVLGEENGDKEEIPNLIRPTIDSKGRVWISGCFPRIYRADGNGGIAMVHEFVPDDFRCREKKRGLNGDLYNPLHVTEDGLGRMWVWSGTEGVIITQWGPNPNLDSCPSLYGVHVISDDKDEVHDDLGATKGGDFMYVARYDKQHMVVSDSVNGVYLVDIENGKTTEMPAPQWELRNVNEIFVDGGDIYAFDRNAGTKLWRWSKNQWTKIVEDFESASSEIGWTPRRWLRLKDGWIVTGFDHEAWFLPTQGKPEMLSWKSAFPIANVKDIVQLKDGSFCVFGKDSRIALCDIASSAEQGGGDNDRIVEVEPASAWLHAKHIWMIPASDATVVKEWDGKAWRPHPLPRVGRGAVGLDEDGDGRIWVFNGDGTTCIYDPAKDQWQSYSTLDDCLATTKGHPVQFLHSTDGQFPAYSADKQRMAHVDFFSTIHYFDGNAWHLYRGPDITGWPGDRDFTPIWFDAKGRLCVSARGGGATWQLDESGQWSSLPAAEQKVSPAPPPKSKFAASDLQKDCLTQNANTARSDGVAAIWFTRDGNLYRCTADHCDPVFAPTEVTPFNSTPYLLEVDVDSEGNAFIETLAAETHRYLVLAKKPGK